MSKQRRTYTVQSVENGFDLIEALMHEKDSSTISSLSKQLGLSSRKTASLLGVLEKKGIIECDERNSYRLGLSAFALAHQIKRCAALTRLAHPIMLELARKHDEAIYLTVPSNDEVLFLNMVDSMQQIKTTTLVGRCFPYFTNAAGKVIKAASSGVTIKKVCSDLAQKSDIKDIHKLEMEFENIRKRGVAVDDGGLGGEICEVAVAIKDYAGWTIGALTMLAPSFRMLQERLEQEIIPSMLEGAEELSKKFGYSKLQFEV